MYHSVQFKVINTTVNSVLGEVLVAWYKILIRLNLKVFNTRDFVVEPADHLSGFLTFQLLWSLMAGC